MMMGKKLYRPYYVGSSLDGSPVTTKWYRTKEEAKSWAKAFVGWRKFKIVSKDVNTLMKNRKKTGFRGLI